PAMSEIVPDGYPGIIEGALHRYDLGNRTRRAPRLRCEGTTDNSSTRPAGRSTVSGWSAIGCLPAAAPDPLQAPRGRRSRGSPRGAEHWDAPGSRLPGDLAGPGEHEAHGLVPEVGGRVEHQRAAAVDDRDPVPAAVLGGRRGNAAGPERTVHPHVL